MMNRFCDGSSTGRRFEVQPEPFKSLAFLKEQAELAAAKLALQLCFLLTEPGRSAEVN